MMTSLSHRGRGIARALLREAEAMAIARRRTLLVLDTATEDGASHLYERVGFTLSGIIPDYALQASRRPCRHDDLLETDRRGR